MTNGNLAKESAKQGVIGALCEQIEIWEQENENGTMSDRQWFQAIADHSKNIVKLIEKY